MTNYRERSGIIRTAGGDVLPIEDVGDIFLRFLSDSGAFDIQLVERCVCTTTESQPLVITAIYSRPPYILRYEKWCGVTVQVRSNATS